MLRMAAVMAPGLGRSFFRRFCFPFSDRLAGGCFIPGSPRHGRGPLGDECWPWPRGQWPTWRGCFSVSWQMCFLGARAHTHSTTAPVPQSATAPAPRGYTGSTHLLHECKQCTRMVASECPAGWAESCCGFSESSGCRIVSSNFSVVYSSQHNLMNVLFGFSVTARDPGRPADLTCALANPHSLCTVPFRWKLRSNIVLPTVSPPCHVGCSRRDWGICSLIKIVFELFADKNDHRFDPRSCIPLLLWSSAECRCLSAVAG